MEYGIVNVDIHVHADQDLDRLWENDPEAAAAVHAALEQLEADPKFIDKLTTYGNNNLGQSSISVKRWESARGKGNLWRFRVLDTPATEYRVVYGYHWQTRQLCVLAIAHKEEFDYDNHNSGIAQRVLADWRVLF